MLLNQHGQLTELGQISLITPVMMKIVKMVVVCKQGYIVIDQDEFHLVQQVALEVDDNHEHADLLMDNLIVVLHQFEIDVILAL